MCPPGCGATCWSFFVEVAMDCSRFIFSQHLPVLDITLLQLSAVKRAADDLEGRRGDGRAAAVHIPLAFSAAKGVILSTVGAFTCHFDQV